MRAEDLADLPFVSVRGRVYIDREALLAYLERLAATPEPTTTTRPEGSPAVPTVMGRRLTRESSEA